MEAPGRVRGMRRRDQPRGQPHFVLPPNLYNEPPVGGLFSFKFTGGNHSRSRDKENDVEERYEKPKITYGRAKAGAVLLSILLRSLSNKFGV